MSRVRVPEGVPPVECGTHSTGTPSLGLISRISNKSPTKRVVFEEEERLVSAIPRISNASPAKRVAFEEEERRADMQFSPKAGMKCSEPVPTTRPVGQVVKTAASHAAIRSSTLLRVTIFSGAKYGSREDKRIEDLLRRRR